MQDFRSLALDYKAIFFTAKGSKVFSFFSYSKGSKRSEMLDSWFMVLDSWFFLHLLINVKHLFFKKLFLIFVKIFNHHGFNALFIRLWSFIRTFAVIDVSSYRFISEKFQGLYPLIPVRFKTGNPSFFNNHFEMCFRQTKYPLLFCKIALNLILKHISFI